VRPRPAGTAYQRSTTAQDSVEGAEAAADESELAEMSVETMHAPTQSMVGSANDGDLSPRDSRGMSFGAPRPVSQSQTPSLSPGSHPASKGGIGNLVVLTELTNTELGMLLVELLVGHH